MSHFAKLDENNVVTFVTVGRQEDDGVEAGTDRSAPAMSTSRLLTTLGAVSTTPNGVPSEDQSKALRFNYAGIGFTYDEGRDAFIPPQALQSWVLDEDTCLWVPPLPYPEDGGQITFGMKNAIDWTAVENETE